MQNACETHVLRMSPRSPKAEAQSSWDKHEGTTLTLHRPRGQTHYDTTHQERADSSATQEGRKGGSRPQLCSSAHGHTGLPLFR